MALRSNFWVEITPNGEKAWRESNLPLDERRLLGACHQSVNQGINQGMSQGMTIGDLYQKIGGLKEFEDCVQTLIQKGFLVLKNTPPQVCDKNLENGVEIADESSLFKSKKSGLRDLLGKLQKSSTSSITTTSSSTLEEEHFKENDLEDNRVQPPKNGFSLWSSSGSQVIADELDDFAKQLMAPEDDDLTSEEKIVFSLTDSKKSDLSTHSRLKENEVQSQLDERLLVLDKWVNQNPENSTENKSQNVENNHINHHPYFQGKNNNENKEEDDDEDENQDWLSQKPVGFVGAQPTENTTLSSPRFTKLNQSLSRITALEQERESAKARGLAYKEKKEQETFESQQKLASTDIREKVRQANEEQEARSFKNMAEQLKLIKKQKDKNEIENKNS